MKMAKIPVCIPSFNVKKKHILIVGGTKGAGKMGVEAFARKGYQVSVIARTVPGGTQQSIRRTRYWKADVLDGLVVKKTLAEIIRLRGKITALVFFQRYRGTGDNFGRLRPGLP